MPRSRNCNHKIILQLDAHIIKVRPYRYRHNKKSYIETQVQNMLVEGLIEESSNPFSFPMLLVKKKNGSWPCCTNYRALNAITIKDAFPIPVVDELNGANFFSKLDIRSGYHQILLHPEDRH